MNKLFVFTCGLILFCSHSLTAQENRGGRFAAFKSVEVSQSGDVTFRIRAPQATEVRLNSGDIPNAAGSPPRTLTKGENGIWEITLPAVPGGSYRYTFSVDGATMVDPLNDLCSPSNMALWSLIHVPGSNYSDTKSVPHGSISAIEYPSTTLNRVRRAHVYLPPNYEKGTETYPVLYLLHGASDSDASWSTVGRAGAVLDNLFAAGKAKPMLVVMPAGHTGAFTFGGPSNLDEQMKLFQQDFVNDLKPHIESRYRISNERSHRAIAGLSMGGAQTLEIALSHLDQFAYIGVFSSGVFEFRGNAPNPAAAGSETSSPWLTKHEAALNDAKLKEGLKLVWFATGKDDFLLKTTQATVKVLRDHKFDVTYEETDGGHTWIKWREHYLPEFAQKLFKD
jgi:enterochelin esterase-like enzyme